MKGPSTVHPRPPMAVVIPSLAGKWLLPCLESLAKQAPGAPVWVVSGGVEEARQILSGFPGVRLLGAPASAGFSVLVNQGLRAAREAGGSGALLLNDDAILQPGCLPLLTEALEQPGVVAVGPVILGGDGKVQSAGISVTFRGMRVRLRSQLPRQQEPHSVPALSGAVLALNLSAWEGVGGFDEGFPFYFEDIDLCLRLRERGGRVLLVPQARAVHHGGGTLSGEDPGAARWALQGHLRLVEKRGGRLGALLSGGVRALAMGDRFRRGQWKGGLGLLVSGVRGKG